jgi:hypothetical protein
VEIGGKIAYAGRSEKDRGEYRQAAGLVAQRMMTHSPEVFISPGEDIHARPGQLNCGNLSWFS